MMMRRKRGGRAGEHGGAAWHGREGGRRYLDDVVLEADALLLLAGSVLDVEDADEVGGPAAEEAVEDLQHDAGHHSQLGEGVGKGESLHSTKLDQSTSSLFSQILYQHTCHIHSS